MEDLDLADSQIVALQMSVQANHKRQRLDHKSLSVFEEEKEKIKPSKNNFDVPHVLVQPEVMIRDQGQRDCQAIMAIRDINVKVEQVDQIKVAALTQLLNMLPQETVTLFLEQEKAGLQTVKRILMMIMQSVSSLDTEALISLSYTALIL